ncbi:hypothetical protein E4T56_gene12120 [Termitomyces sp. T112]|nr:hypothetical protein E4T56_gene12120 [Termitomyces sp. T112]
MPHYIPESLGGGGGGPGKGPPFPGCGPLPPLGGGLSDPGGPGDGPSGEDNGAGHRAVRMRTTVLPERQLQWFSMPPQHCGHFATPGVEEAYKYHCQTMHDWLRAVIEQLLAICLAIPEGLKLRWNVGEANDEHKEEPAEADVEDAFEADVEDAFESDGTQEHGEDEELLALMEVPTGEHREKEPSNKRLGSIAMTNKLLPSQRQAAKTTMGALHTTAGDVLDLHANLLPVYLLFYKVLY